MVDPKYREWIEINYGDPRSAISMCAEATDRMQKAFPELTRTNGFIQVIGDLKERMHWWLKSPDGHIIDPTAHQYYVFNSGILSYREIDDSHPARNYEQDRCANCGEYYYRTPEVKGLMHNEKCNKEFIDYLNGADDEDWCSD